MGFNEMDLHDDALLVVGVAGQQQQLQLVRKPLNLSGGNQQKVIVARELSRGNKLIVASQPTRGLDIGSIEYIHAQLVRQRDEGCAVLLISSELDEIMSLADRVLVMYKGQAMTLVDRDKTTKEKIGLYMAGVMDPSEKADSHEVES